MKRKKKVKSPPPPPWYLYLFSQIVIFENLLNFYIFFNQDTDIQLHVANFEA